MARELKSEKARKHVLSKAFKERVRNLRSYAHCQKVLGQAIARLPGQVVCPRVAEQKTKKS